MRYICAAIVTIFSAFPVFGDIPVIEKVDVSVNENAIRFDVTVRHADTGWDHYADNWQVTADDGTRLGLRVLHHPHVDEQPFTRSLTIDRTPDLKWVFITPNDSVHGAGLPFEIALPSQ